MVLEAGGVFQLPESNTVRFTNLREACLSSNSAVQIIAHGKGVRVGELSPGEKWRLFWLGLVEAVPASAGMAAGLTLESTFASAGVIALGVIITVIVTWLLRKKVPELPVELAESVGFDGNESHPPR